MSEPLDQRRMVLFLLFAFGIAWLVGLAIYWTGGLINSPALIPHSPFTLAVVLLAVGYMPAPALAHVLTRIITNEGWTSLYLRPHLRQGWPYWVTAWLLPTVLVVAGGIVFYTIFPGHFDGSLGVVSKLLDDTAQRTGRATPSPVAFVISQGLVAVLFAPITNGLFTFGEEFGWRAYLQPKLMALGPRRAVLVTGVIWGIWHWPVIAMGHNYGVSYAGWPWLGMLAMTWMTVLIGIFFAWLTLRSGSIWPAVIAHASVNGIAAVTPLFARGEPNPILGPTIAGVIGSVPLFIAAVWIFSNAKALSLGRD